MTTEQPTPEATTPEMHWSRWGDPAQAGPLPETALALVDAFIGTSDTPAVAPGDVVLSAPLPDDLVAELTGIVGAEHVLLDHDTRLHRTRGKSTPDLLKLRHGDGSDSPDAVVRPGSHDEVAAVIAWCVRRHVALVPFGGGTSVVGGLAARREGFAGVVSLDLIRFDKLLEVDHDSMTALLEPGLRGPQAEALLAAEGAHARALPAVVRVRLDRRLRGDPVLGPVLGRLRPVRLPRRRPEGRHASGHPRARQLTRRTLPAPTCASW